MTTRKENNVHNWIMNGPKLVAFMGKRGELNAQDMIPRYVWVDIQTDVKATRPANAPALSIGKIKARAPLHVETSDAGPSNWQDRGSAQGGFASAASAASTPTPSAAPATATTPAGTGRVQFPSLEPVPSQAGPSAYTRNVKDRDSESRGYWRKGP
ncbi:hypothetical protein MMC19_005272 [Ptychographa xylographoides]|nr:hypothetical protein [Ptychographa xylographoides]